MVEEFGDTVEADLVSALLAARDDPATRAFDDALARAERSGRLDAATARELRFWQRQGIEALAEHAARVVPAALAARRASDAAAREGAAEAALSWTQATALRSEAADEDAPPPEGPDHEAMPTGASAPRLIVSGLTVVPDPESGPEDT